MKTTQRIGLYAWGGPGTIRLIETKYHSPRIDHASFLDLYELDTLQKIRDTLQVTDMWVTYSWGFSASKEEEDFRFIQSRLPNFSQAGIRPHAYIQGLNVVTADFPQADFFAVDGKGKPLSYSKGRSFLCPNHPAARRHILDRVKSACQLDFAGIYIDNILFGLPPLYVRKEYASSFGCACSFCQKRFFRQYGYHFSPSEKQGKELQDFLRFRCDSVYALLKSISLIAKRSHKEFGINLYDPVLLAPATYYGYDLEQIAPLLDYFLIENHQHPLSTKTGNQHLRDLISRSKKPVFMVSYKRGIGREPAFRQRDFDAVAHEAARLSYSPCYKGTEFTTRGTWHALRLEDLHPPFPESVHSLPQKRQIRARSPKPPRKLGKLVVHRLDPFYPRFVRAQYETAWLHKVIHKSGIFTVLMKRNQLQFEKNAWHTWKLPKTPMLLKKRKLHFLARRNEE